MITRPRRVVAARAGVLILVIGVLAGGLNAMRSAIIPRPATPPAIVAMSGSQIDPPATGLPDGAGSVGTRTLTWAPTALPTGQPASAATVSPTATRAVILTALPTVTFGPSVTRTASVPPPTIAPTPTLAPTATATATLAPTATQEPLPAPTATAAPTQNAEDGVAAAAAVASDPEIAALAARINRVRAEVGRVTLAWSPELAEAARIQAEDMATHGFVSHTGSDGSDVVERLRRVGYEPAFRGEIIAWAPGGADLAFDWWWHSDLHHDTMLGPAYRDFGIARVPHPTRSGHNYFVVVFGRR